MKISIFLSLLFSLLIISCKTEENTNPNTVELNFNFSHLVDAAPVQLDQLIYKNALDQDFSIKTVKYFISALKLYKADNTVKIFSDIIYVDIRTPKTLNYTFASKISAGDYTGISFVYGLTPEENITGRFPEPPESLMEWPVPMGGGYHYAKIEGQYTTEDNYFNFHSGMLNGTAYEIHVDLKNHPFTVSGANLNLDLKMEIQNWFTNPTDWDFAYWGPGIMGNPVAQKTVQENGVDVFTFAVVENL